MPEPGSRDPGLDAAIRAAGGVGELARRLGVSQPSVSGWKRIPAERIARVEAATGLTRAALRPDLYEAQPQRDDLDLARAREYALLARLLLRAPDAALLSALAQLRGDATELGLSRIALAEAASATSAEAVGHEYFDLFIGVGRGDVLPYASFYLTGFLLERPLVAVRQAMAELGLARDPQVAEPEDHLGTLCEIMSGLADGSIVSDDSGEAFFRKHLAPWAARCLADIAAAPSANFYRAVGRLGQGFIGIETEAFALPA
jgi:TorA maturation chaperone TorD